MLGAGDGFMSGLLEGLADRPGLADRAEVRQRLRRLRRLAATAAPRPIRRGRSCAFFLDRGIKVKALRHDAELEQLHWSTNRLGDWPEMRVFAFDHRMQLEEVADELGVGARAHRRLQAALPRGGAARSPPAAPATASSATAGSGATRSTPPPARASGSAARSRTPAPGRCGCEIEPDYGSALAEWPLEHVVKVLAFYHPDDDAGDEGRPGGDRACASPAPPAPTGWSSCSRSSRPRSRPVTDTTSAEIIQRFYDLGVYPDWWKLEPMKTDAAWANACAAITRNDPHTRGIVVLGLEAPTDELAASFAVAARHDLVKGFAVGRTIFADAARAWLGGAITDARGGRGHGRQIRTPLPHLGRGARRRKGAAA